jgi:HAD superfamily hydrolase (TIGR01450 family)
LNVLCDLDGVIYRGGVVIDGARDALRRLEEAAVDIFFITNNSTRSPEQGAEKVKRLTGIEIDPHQVLGSSLAAVSMLGPDDGPVLMVGEHGVRDAIERAGLDVTTDPKAARAVLVGLTREITYELLSDAMSAIRSGARFIATNDDATLPTENDLLPGAGAIVAAIAAATDQEPEIAGKPHEAMRKLIRSRGVGEAWVIGDRADTDIVLARDEPDWRSILVLTGVTDADEAASAGADHVAQDFSAAVDLVLSEL